VLPVGIHELLVHVVPRHFTSMGSPDAMLGTAAAASNMIHKDPFFCVRSAKAVT
jgi:hypothetical protein